MPVQAPFHLGLVVRSETYEQRSPRTQLDVALLAATLDFDVTLYFIGAAVLQLVPGTDTKPDTGAALLPAGYRAWASLPDLFEQAELEAFAEPEWLHRLQGQDLQSCLPLQARSPLEMRLDWARCDRLLVL